MADLNKKKPYGTIYGKHFASYEQDNKYFDHAGKEIKAEKKSESKPKNSTSK